MFGKFKKKLAPPTPGANVFTFKLGDRVKDKISGLEGVLMNRFYHLSGCDRFMFETDPKDGKLGECVHVDGQRLELVTAFADRHRDEVPDTEIKLGDEAVDIVTGLKGIVTIINVPLHGSMQFCITPGYDPKEKKMPEAFFTDECHVEVTKPLTSPDTKAVEDKPAPKKKPPGAMPLGSGWR